LEALYILLGWLLGLLSPGIAERIRRKHRQKDLMASVMGELADLRYMMATYAYRVGSHIGHATDDLLDWCLRIMETYDGPEAQPELLKCLHGLRKASEEQRKAAYLTRRTERGAVALKECSLPFTEALRAELSICPLWFQRRLWFVIWQLDIFNQQVAFVMQSLEKTFDSTLTSENQEALSSNIEKGYKAVSERARAIADSVTALESSIKLES
jgi:hypothetical protein